MADLVLLSGGIDSLVCAELARQHGRLAGCLFVDYGHPAQIPEGWKAFAYAGSRGVRLKVVHAFGLDLGEMATEHGARVVPSRNALLLAAAANAAPSLGASRIVIGCNAADQRDYADCRAPFLVKMAHALDVPIAAPLLGLGKGEIIEQARSLGLTQADAWSCYLAGPTECGACPSCLEAQSAWSATARTPAT